MLGFAQIFMLTLQTLQKTSFNRGGAVEEGFW